MGIYSKGTSIGYRVGSRTVLGWNTSGIVGGKTKATADHGKFIEHGLSVYFLTSLSRLQKDGSIKRSVMKKAYRILEELCARPTPTIENFLNEARSTFLLDHLLISLTISQSAWKGVRFTLVAQAATVTRSF